MLNELGDRTPWMILASTPDTGNLEDLAQLADKIVEVAVPPPSIFCY